MACHILILLDIHVLSLLILHENTAALLRLASQEDPHRDNAVTILTSFLALPTTVLSRTILVLYNGSQLRIGLKWGEMHYRCRREHFTYFLILYKMGKHAPKTVSSISRQSDSEGRGSSHLACSDCQRGSGFHRGMCLTTQEGFFRSFKPKAQVELRHTRFQR